MRDVATRRRRRSWPVPCGGAVVFMGRDSRAWTGEMLAVRDVLYELGGISRRTFYRWRELRLAPPCIPGSPTASSGFGGTCSTTGWRSERRGRRREVVQGRHLEAQYQPFREEADLPRPLVRRRRTLPRVAQDEGAGRSLPREASSCGGQGRAVRHCDRSAGLVTGRQGGPVPARFGAEVSRCPVGGGVGQAARQHNRRPGNRVTRAGETGPRPTVSGRF